jgi:hypothetical protein
VSSVKSEKNIVPQHGTTFDLVGHHREHQRAQQDAEIPGGGTLPRPIWTPFLKMVGATQPQPARRIVQNRYAARHDIRSAAHLRVVDDVSNRHGLRRTMPALRIESLNRPLNKPPKFSALSACPR